MKAQNEPEEKDYFKNIHFLYLILGKTKDGEIIKAFLKDILTRSEMRMLRRRWHIANLLNEGFDIRQTAAKTRAGTNTVIKIKQILEKEESTFKKAIDYATKIAEEERKKYLNSIKPSGGSKFVKGWFR